MAKLIGFCAVVFVSVCAFGQIPKLDTSVANGTFNRESQTYGTQGEIAYVVHASAFSTWNSTQTYSGSNGGAFTRYVTNNNGCCLVTSVSLPSGASVIGIEVEGCDNSATAAIVGVFFACNSTGCSISLPSIATLPNVGCAQFRTNFTTPITVDNSVNSYFLEFYHVGDISGDVYLSAMRVYYKLQVSPAPATATFTDVPTTHAFFQYIEALAAAGITAGCNTTPPQYCPDAPVTRGQMAVFLARALGLHWVP